MNRMMKKIISGAVCGLLAFAAGAQAQGLNFDRTLSWAQLKEKAKAEHKYIFMDVMATWCGPCKAMERDVYPQKEVGDFFNGKFIAVKVQNDQTKNDDSYVRSWYADSRQISSQFNITALPTLMFFSPDGDLLYKTEGGQSADDLIASAKTALDPSKQLTTQVALYEKGNHDPAFVRSLVLSLRNAGQREKASAIASEYLSGLSESQLLESDNVLFGLDLTDNANAKWFPLYLKNRDKIIASGNQPGFVRSKINILIYRDAVAPFEHAVNNGPDWGKIKNGVSRYGALGDSVLQTYAPLIVWNGELLPLMYTYPSWEQVNVVIDRAGNAAREYLLSQALQFYTDALPSPSLAASLNSCAEAFERLRPGVTPAGGYNLIAWTIYQNTADKALLEAALAWSKRSVDKDSNASFLDTYATILYALGRKQEAVQWESKAADGAGNNAEIQATLAQMKSGQALTGLNRKVAAREQLTGKWTLDREKSDFAGQAPENAAPLSLNITQTGSGITIARSFQSAGLSADTLRWDGAGKASVLGGGTKVQRKLILSRDGGTVTVWSVYYVARPGEEPAVYSRADSYQADGAEAGQLLLHRMTYTAQGVEKVKAVYRKE